jgi:hypothetical protein
VVEVDGDALFGVDAEHRRAHAAADGDAVAGLEALGRAVLSR